MADEEFKNTEAHKMQDNDELPDMDTWVKGLKIKTTEEIDVPPLLADQVIGQEKAVRVMKKAAEQKRHVLLIGEPGTGKSMIARSMVDYLPSDDLEDIIAYHNPEDDNEPIVRSVPAGKGKEIVQAKKSSVMKKMEERARTRMMIIGAVLLITIFAYLSSNGDGMILIFGIIAAAMIFMVMKNIGVKEDKENIPKLLLTHDPEDKPPFVDATGAHAGALLGDVRHDPFQSGGLETPAHERLEAGAIHKAHKGVLFIDELNMLKIESQHSLLTSLQDKKFSIFGQSERSSGALVKSQPVPCDYVLVAAGNLDSIQGIHPALRSRIRGYGYEVFMNDTFKDTLENRNKIVRFIAQEVRKDNKIPHFDKTAIAEILKESQKRAGRKGKLTLRLRELGGLIRVAGDVAHEKNKKMVSAEDVKEAKKIAQTLEQQVVERGIEHLKRYKTFNTSGNVVGMVNGLSVYDTGSGMNELSGMVLPIVAEITPAQSREEGKIIATGKLGEIAKEAVQNVSALIKKHTGKDISNYDIHIQFIGTYDGVEGDSASVTIATAVISALESIPVKQNIAMTGSLSVRGDVLPVGGISAKIEGAYHSGIYTVLIPESNLQDVLIDEDISEKMNIIPVVNLKDVLKNAFEPEISKRNSFMLKLASSISDDKKDDAHPIPF